MIIFALSLSLFVLLQIDIFVIKTKLLSFAYFMYAIISMHIYYILIASRIQSNLSIFFIQAAKAYTDKIHLSRSRKYQKIPGMGISPSDRYGLHRDTDDSDDNKIQRNLFPFSVLFRKRVHIYTRVHSRDVCAMGPPRQIGFVISGGSAAGSCAHRA